MKKTRILFVQHAAALGGSVMSLLYTMLALDKSKYEWVLALVRPSPEVLRLYREAGIQTFAWPGITPWDHSTVAYKPIHLPSSWIHLFKVAYNWRLSERRTIELVSFVKPDIVHLNSMPLSPCARALAMNRIPVVWHVREPPMPNWGLRFRIIRNIMSLVDELLFISVSDQNAWVQGKRGVVVRNFVNFNKFDRSIDGGTTRKEFGIPDSSPVILYLGGISVVKGIFPLLEAISYVRDQLPGLRCIMPGSVLQPSNRIVSRVERTVLPPFGSGTLVQKVEAAIDRLGLQNVCIRTPYRHDVANLMAASDVVVFPALRPHFARPIIEAGAMAKPVVASRLPGITELVDEGQTGILVQRGRPLELASALQRVLREKWLAARLGASGFDRAKRMFSDSTQIGIIESVYEKILAGNVR